MPVFAPSVRFCDPILPHSTPLKIFNRLTGDYAYETHWYWGFSPLYGQARVYFYAKVIIIIKAYYRTLDTK
jgi:hypothetical protein